MMLLLTRFKLQNLAVELQVKIESNKYLIF